MQHHVHEHAHAQRHTRHAQTAAARKRTCGRTLHIDGPRPSCAGGRVHANARKNLRTRAHSAATVICINLELIARAIAGHKRATMFLEPSKGGSRVIAHVRTCGHGRAREHTYKHARTRARKAATLIVCGIAYKRTRAHGHVHAHPHIRSTCTSILRCSRLVVWWF